MEKYQVYAFDSTTWKDDFDRASSERQRDALSSLRINVWEGTMQAVNDGCYMAGSRIVRPFRDKEMRQGTKFYSQALDASGVAKTCEKTMVDVINEDCLVAADYLSFLGYNPVVLNMASAINPGGGVVKGSGAQEENLFRRTDLFRSLFSFARYAGQYRLERHAQQYPLDRSWGGIYTPHATVFRGRESDGYPLLPYPHQMSFVAVAAVNRPDTDEEGNLTPQMVELTKRKMRTILRIALLNGHDALVMGAMGCGAFRNPPAHVARTFHEVIEEEEFAGKLKRVTFAIIDDHNAHRPHNPEGNFLPFAREFPDKGCAGFRHIVESRHAPMIMQMRIAAHALHESVGQRYGKRLPYGTHLDMVARAVIEYGDEVCQDESDIAPVMFSALFHDSIEDARQTYNDTLRTARTFMADDKARLAADIVYALSNDKGKTRAERAGDSYYKGIRETPYAPFIKFADRLANMRFSAECALLGDSHMKEVYAKELPHFIGCLTSDIGSADVRRRIPRAMIEECERLGS